MADFKVGYELDIVVPDDQLRSARDQIERELGDIGISVDAAGVGPGGGGQPRDPATGQFASPMGPEEFERSSLNLAETRNELLEGILDEVEDGAAFGSAGQSGGGGTSIIPVGGRGMATVGGLLAGGAAGAAGIAGLFGGRESLRNVNVFDNIGALLSGEIEQGEVPTLEEGLGTAIAGLGGPIGGLFAEDITAALEGFDMPDLGVGDLVSDPLALEAPAIPDLSPGDLVEDALSLEAPTIPDEITPDDILEFIGVGGDEPTPGPAAGAEGRQTFREADTSISESRGPAAGREGRQTFREADTSISVSNDITVGSDVISRRDVERITDKKIREAIREIERQMTRQSGVR